MKKKTLLITDERVEKCVCGKKYKTWTELCEIKHKGRVGKKRFRYNYPNMACHCKCGAKWGKHDLEVEIVKKDYCVSCGQPNKWQVNRGNYCVKCGSKCERLIEIKGYLEKPQKNRDKISNLLKELKKWHIDLNYILKSKKELDIINKVLKI